MQHDHFGNPYDEDEHDVAKAVRGFWYNVLDVLLNVVIIIVIVTVVRSFVISPFEVEGSSMTPTLEDNQYIIINKFGYIWGEPKRGDVVVFRPPTDISKYYVKRIIGTPGDTVIIRDGHVFLDVGNKEVKIDEHYLSPTNLGRTYNAHGQNGEREMSYTVPQNSYFLLGDNRQGSLDSRNFKNDDNQPMPFVQSKSISGRVWFVALPIKKSHALEQPKYGLQ